MTPSGAPRRLWRIVRTDPPTRADFVSHAAKGRRAPSDPGRARLWDGVSLYDTEAQARYIARTFPRLGVWLAAVDVPRDGSYRIARTGKDAGHYTVWGDTDGLLAAVAYVTPVESEDGNGNLV